MSKTTTLKNLIEEYGANAFVVADAGNGSSYGEAGRTVDYDEACADEYGDTEMSRLDAPSMSEDGRECLYASGWITKGEGDNPFRVRIYF